MTYVQCRQIGLEATYVVGCLHELQLHEENPKSQKNGFNGRNNPGDSSELFDKIIRNNGWDWAGVTGLKL